MEMRRVLGDDAVDAQQFERPFVGYELIHRWIAGVRDMVQAGPVERPDARHDNAGVDVQRPRRL